MTLEPATGVERLIKSVDRIRDLAEVYTPASTVQSMLDLLPEAMWATHPSPTFLEPACGDGNFVVAVLDRKLDSVAADHAAGALAAGDDDEAIEFHALEALASIYAVDISPDNVIGGTPGHEFGARDRLIGLFADRLAELLGRRLDAGAAVLRAAHWIVTRNVQVGNMLATAPDGRSSKRDDLPIREYTWDAEHRTVTVRRTTLGSVMTAEDDEMSLFGAPKPALEWQGHVLDLSALPSPTTAATTATATQEGI